MTEIFGQSIENAIKPGWEKRKRRKGNEGMRQERRVRGRARGDDLVGRVRMASVRRYG